MRRLTVLLVITALALGLPGRAQCGHCGSHARPSKCHHGGADKPAVPSDCACPSHHLACSPSRTELVAPAPMLDARLGVAPALLAAPGTIASVRAGRVTGRASPPLPGPPVYLSLHALLI